MPEHVASISYGKDSLAMLHVIVNVLHWPLDRIVTADEWATEDVPTELPEQIAFEERMDELIPESGLAVIPGVGHYSFLEAPEAFRMILRAYLTEVE